MPVPIRTISSTTFAQKERPEKAERVFDFHRNTLYPLAETLAAASLDHSSQIGPHRLVRRVRQTEIRLFS